MPGEQRTEAPTERRRRELRGRGHTARSLDLNAAVGITAGVLVLDAAGGGLVGTLQNLLRQALVEAPHVELTVGAATAMAIGVALVVLAALAPLFLAFAGIGIATSVGQVGFVFATDSVTPNLGRLNLANGLKRVIGAAGLLELGKALLKVAIGAYVAYAVLSSYQEALLLLPRLSLRDEVAALLAIGRDLGLKLGLVLLALAGADYLYQRRRTAGEMRMTKQELKDELKNTEGNPQIRSRIRQIQRRMARRRMMQNVPKADVVVTNPTHIAVALLFDERRMRAPQVIAKGEDLLAERIKQIAREHGVPLVENVPLARALNKAADVGDWVPVELYQAVAEVLAFVYRLRRRSAQ